ncbi:hypothetical protein SISNIDRAFT_550018 [Sistotremastrum niveocremeum HHB9708]|uniref:PHD-type domain-containing protein n=1 Tax=Sistotremastrum niveocremeum HHB9708 TaxID=1314777 RepID=A0A164U7Q4_9AGAM|nr:hypothetical protein SISNIDRAFT_550018 [Sistotremastrum niveocremeum HHB9708]
MSGCTFIQFTSHVFPICSLNLFIFSVIGVLDFSDQTRFGTAHTSFLSVMERRLAIASLLADGPAGPEPVLRGPKSDPEPTTTRPSLSPTFSSLATLADVAEQASRRAPSLSPTIYTRPLDNLVPEPHRPLPPTFSTRSPTPPPLLPPTHFEPESFRSLPLPPPFVSQSYSSDHHSSFPAEASKTYQAEQDDLDSELLSLVDSRLPPPSAPQPSTSKLSDARPKPPPKPAKTATKKVAKGPTKAPPAKPRAKPGPKPGNSAAARAKNAAAASAPKKSSLLAKNARSRSVSQMEEVTETAAPEEIEPADERLYCICQTPYDDRIMIACDRCDEWYHPPCLGMDDSIVELLDVFFCSSCQKINPKLQSTQKPLCHRPTCGKPSQKASKYCSQECGVLHMKNKLREHNLNEERVWEVVKNIQRSEGEVLSASGVPAFTNRREELQRQQLNHQLDRIVQERDLLQKDTALTETRAAFLKYVLNRNIQSEKAGKDECGWDGRLLWGDEQWRKAASEGYDWTMDAKQKDIEKEDDRSCRADGKCERHAGWQRMREKDLEKIRSQQALAMNKLTERERDIRLRLEQISPREDNANLNGRKNAANSSTTSTKSMKFPKISETLLTGRATKSKGKPLRPKINGATGLLKVK